MQSKKLFQRIVAGQIQSIHFGDLCILLSKLGFEHRQKGSHHIFTRNDLSEIVNLQPNGKDAKTYQVRQIREIIERCRLTL